MNASPLPLIHAARPAYAGYTALCGSSPADDGYAPATEHAAWITCPACRAIILGRVPTVPHAPIRQTARVS